MKYEGLIGKIGSAIPNSSTAKFAGIGAAVVAPIGAGLSYYENQDWGDAAAGALRSAAFGGILGVATHRVPGIVASNTAGVGLKRLATNEDAMGLVETVMTKVKPFKTAYDDNPDGILDGEGYMAALSSIRDSQIYKDTVGNFAENRKRILEIKDESKWQLAKSYVSGVTEAGFNSVYSHVVKPTGNFLRGDMTLGNSAAAAFTGYGLYEAGSAINEVRQGNYSAAVGVMSTLAAAKAGYAGLAGGYKAYKVFDKAGVTPIDLYHGVRGTVLLGAQNPLLHGNGDVLGVAASSYMLSTHARKVAAAIKKANK